MAFVRGTRRGIAKGFTFMWTLEDYHGEQESLQYMWLLGGYLEHEEVRYIYIYIYIYIYGRHRCTMGAEIRSATLDR